ncbi:hypothetical protein GCM10023329_42860 [Streptomyces sanyensis]|uniref:Uncharacterized protein n=1 Tax=Streptomyces sanyensis TaxID=568869 RepID=A0ABP9AY03_9ACTN
MILRSAAESVSYERRRGECAVPRCPARRVRLHATPPGRPARPLTRRGDTLFEIIDAMLCENGLVASPVNLTRLTQHRSGHGALHDAPDCGRIEADALRHARTLRAARAAALPHPGTQWTLQ